MKNPYIAAPRYASRHLVGALRVKKITQRKDGDYSLHFGNGFASLCLMQTRHVRHRRPQVGDCVVFDTQSISPELYSAAAFKALFEKSKTENLRGTLHAIKARIEGVFDDPDLKAYGPLSTDSREDILNIVTTALACSQKD